MCKSILVWLRESYTSRQTLFNTLIAICLHYHGVNMKGQGRSSLPRYNVLGKENILSNEVGKTLNCLHFMRDMNACISSQLHSLKSSGLNLETKSEVQRILVRVINWLVGLMSWKSWAKRLDGLLNATGHVRGRFIMLIASVYRLVSCTTSRMVVMMHTVSETIVHFNRRPVILKLWL